MYQQQMAVSGQAPRFAFSTTIRAGLHGPLTQSEVLQKREKKISFPCPEATSLLKGLRPG
jgi:hypothetical protein